MNRLHFASISLAVLSLAKVARADDPPAQGGVTIEEVPQEPPPVVAAPPAAQPPPAEQPAPPKKSIPVSLRVDGGYGVRSLEKLEVKGADVGFAIGAQPARHFAVYGAARGFFGSTEGGLDVKALRLTADMDFVIDRFRIGIDPGLFWVGVDRVTKDETIVGWGPKLGLSARVDVIQSDPFALFLRAAADAGATFSDGSLFGGIVLGGGIDFDLKRGDRSTL